MKDAVPTSIPGTWGIEVPAGDGHVDWAHLFSTLQSQKKAIPVVIEREAGDQRIADIIQARTLAAKHGYTP